MTCLSSCAGLGDLQGSRFAILHAEPAVTKPQLSVYDMRDVRNAVKGVSPVLTNPTRNANMICWSPAGKNMVLAGLKARLSVPPLAHLPPFGMYFAFVNPAIESDDRGRDCQESRGFAS